MRVYGIDFTSAPSPRKPICFAMCRLESGTLFLDGLCAFDVMDSFRNFLHMDGPWVAGMDFPFGLPREFLEPLNWRADWCSYVARAASMRGGEFKDLARAVSRDAPAGRRYLKRRTDRLADTRSPMSVVRQPAGLMFHAGAPALLSSGVSVLPVREACGERLVFETYPRLVAEALVGRRSYKDEKSDESALARREARSELLDALAGDVLVEHYGLDLSGVKGLRDELLDDVSGDRVDALMCAVQAAWAWQRRDQGYGFPDDVDAVEGWIADPATRISVPASAVV